MYLHLHYELVPLSHVEDPAAPAELQPRKLAINEEGGFNLKSSVETKKYYSLAVKVGESFQHIPLPNSELPEFVSNVCSAIIDHDGMRTRMQVGVVYFSYKLL